MRDVLPRLAAERAAGRPVGLATVVSTWSSAPRPPGAAMLTTSAGAVLGSVSGGCVEADVYARLEEILAGSPPTLQAYGVSDDDAGAVGLTCGGTIEVFLQSLGPDASPAVTDVVTRAQAGQPMALATVIDHPDATRVGRQLAVRGDAGSAVIGSLGSSRADQAVADDARGLLGSGTSGTLTYGPEGQRRGEGMRVMVSSFAPPPRLLVFGATDFAVAAARLGDFLGYHVTVCDARATFLTEERFTAADELVVEWPHDYLEREAAAGRVDSRTVICALGHDLKFDIPLLTTALRLPEVGYVGAMGSRRTVELRTSQLREAGLTEAELARLRSPLGLDLGGRTPEETAVSIMSEVIAESWGGSGRPLHTGSKPIHQPSGGTAATDHTHQLSKGLPWGSKQGH